MRPISIDADKELEKAVLSQLSEMVYKVIDTSEAITDRAGLRIAIHVAEIEEKADERSLKYHMKVYWNLFCDQKDLDDELLADCISRLVEKGFISILPKASSSKKLTPKDFLTTKIELTEKFWENEKIWSIRTLKSLIEWLDEQIGNIQDETSSKDVQQPSSGEAYRDLVRKVTLLANSFKLITGENWSSTRKMELESAYDQVLYLTKIRDLAQVQRKKTLRGKGSGKPASQGRGRPKHHDVKMDSRIFDMRNVKPKQSCSEIARSLNIKVEAVRRALDRHRKRNAELN